MNNSIEIDVKLKDYDKVINQLKEVKQLLNSIKEIDKEFNLSNVVYADSNTTLIFNMNNIIFREEELNKVKMEIENKTRCKCIILNNIYLDKAIKYGIDKAEDKDYTTTQYFEDGELIKEETIQYK